VVASLRFLDNSSGRKSIGLWDAAQGEGGGGLPVCDFLQKKKKKNILWTRLSKTISVTYFSAEISHRNRLLTAMLIKTLKNKTKTLGCFR
jgi:hypothetical protein